jgi:hypothetical protein
MRAAGTRSAHMLGLQLRHGRSDGENGTAERTGEAGA